MRRSPSGRSALAVLAALVAVLGLSPARSAAAQPTARASIVGGSIAAPGAYPWMVALSRGCGGTLIAPDRVLTAGHCVEGLRVDELRLYVGATRRRRGGHHYDGIPVRAADVATHPDYRPLDRDGPVHDAAVIRLSAPVPDVPLARLAAPQDAADRRGRPATVVGWGVTRTDLRRAPLALILRQGALRILSDASCARIYGREGTYRRSVMLCARSRNAARRPNTSPCVGDSGGPLLSGGLQVGIVSFGISCGALREPTVFARVARLRAFIDLPEPVWAPQPLGAARITGTVRAGAVVACEPPPYRGAVDRVRYRWGLDGLLVATGRRVLIKRSARGRKLQCRAVASNAGGSTPSVASPAIRVPRAG